MDDGIETAEILRLDRLDVTNVLPDGRDRGRVWPEIRGLIQKRVQPRDLVPGGGQDLRHHRADIPVVSRNKYLHVCS